MQPCSHRLRPGVGTRKEMRHQWRHGVRRHGQAIQRQGPAHSVLTRFQLERRKVHWRTRQGVLPPRSERSAEQWESSASVKHFEIKY